VHKYELHEILPNKRKKTLLVGVNENRCFRKLAINAEQKVSDNFNKWIIDLTDHNANKKPATIVNLLFHC